MKSVFQNGKIRLILALGASFVLVACSGKDATVSVDEEIQMRDERISQLEEEARQAQAQLEMSRDEAEEAAQRAAQAGECFARVLVLPVYETTSEQMLVRDASSSIDIVPAKFEWVEEEVLVREASERLVVVPATYKTVEEQVLVKPASIHMVEVPAVYETLTEEVLVTPEGEYWKKGRSPIEKVDGATGEIMCLVKEPAVYETVSKKVLKSQATTREETIPIDAEYRTGNKKVMVEPSYMEWRQVLCETNMNQATILDIQKALKTLGFDPIQLDGIYGPNTQAAVMAFQKSKGLASGSLTFETIEALGLGY